MKLESVYPIVEGYKDSARAGCGQLLRPAAAQPRALAASYSPDNELTASERLHLDAEYERYDWTTAPSWNRADFYDLFGPTKTSRKGYSVPGRAITKTAALRRARGSSSSVDAAYYGDLDAAGLPERRTDFDELAARGARLALPDSAPSLGNVDEEKGSRWNSGVAGDRVEGHVPEASGRRSTSAWRCRIRHSSIWLRGAGGVCGGDRDEPFANFYFGGFGNNWVDHATRSATASRTAFPASRSTRSAAATTPRDARVEPAAVRFRRVGRPAST